ncbi:MAG: ABC transporter permease [Bradyrhizobiaceae bacterium]|nr:MAG: ABC transporter permease [Bradyrhizobiaceae bacterium]
MTLTTSYREHRTGFLPLRFALRELRSGLRGFYVFVACIALGVMAIAGVGSVSGSLSESLEHQGRVLLGGDVSFSLFQREATPDERAFLDRHGKISAMATLRGMARAASGEPALIDIKAVDSTFPALGEVARDPQLPLEDIFARRNGVYGAAADPVLLDRLGLKIGDSVTVGNIPFVIRATVTSEPDKLSSGIGFGPRFLISIDALRATGLLQPGSLVRWVYRVLLPDGASADHLIDESRKALPQAGWEIRSKTNASPQLERSITRFTQFLTLVGLAALLVGGVGVANAVKSHLDARRDVIATFKAMGATAREVFAIYLAQVLLLAVIGAMIGLAIGAALPFILAALFGDLLPLPVDPTFHPYELLLAFIYGLLTALAFAMWPLARAHDVPVAALFREGVSPDFRWPRRQYIVMTAFVAILLAAVAIGLSYDKRVAAVFVAASLGVFALLRAIASLLMAIARRLPRPRFTMLRLALANIHRPAALTPSVVMSLGLGLAVLVTITQIDGNLRRQFMAALPDRAPSFYFIDIPAGEADRFGEFLKQTQPDASVENVPMLRGRIVAAKGVRAEDLKPSQDTEWVLQSDRGISYTDTVPAGSKVVEGKWWEPGLSGMPQVSLEKKIADGLGLKIGDDITVNVLGRDVTARITNLRTVDWQSLGINLVLVFSPNAFKGAPHTNVATLTEPNPSAANDARLIRAVAIAYPSVTSVRVRDALLSVGKVVTNLVLAIRGASSVTLIAALMVLGGALAAGHRHRVYDAVILKTLGATRGRLVGAYVLEYLMIGLATAIFGVAAGSVAAWQIVTRLMNLSFVWEAQSAGLVVLAALVVTIGLGLAGTLLALHKKPAEVLRNL